MPSILGQFLREPGSVGAVCASSRFLAEAVSSEIGLEKAAAVAELGPGTGAFTGAIIDKLDVNAKFFAIELNARLCDLCREKFPGISFHNRCATELPEIMAEEEVGNLDAVVSGLPWASFPDELQDALLDALCAGLRPGGKFSTFAYLQGMLLPAAHRFRHRLNKRFSKVEKSSVVWLNLPPAFVYRCEK